MGRGQQTKITHSPVVTAAKGADATVALEMPYARRRVSERRAWRLAGIFPANDLQCVQVSQQVVELLRGQLVPEARHLRPSQQDDVGYPIVICGNAILHVGPLEQAIEAGTAQLALAVCKMTFRATCIVDAATVGLLHIQSQLGIGLSRFRVAGSKKQSCKQSNGEFENQGRGFTLQRYLPGLWELANCGQHETDAQSLRELEYTSR